jgi:hypothetical protein
MKLNILLFQRSIRHFTWRTMYVLLLLANKFALKALLCNHYDFYVAGSHMKLNNTFRVHCYVSTTTVVTRMHHIVVLYVHCLSF